VNSAAAFWDASALVPACVHEQASHRVRLLLKAAAPVVWWATGVEVYSAIGRLYRDRQITDQEKQRAVTRLRAISLIWREMVPDDYVRDMALTMLDKYPLRAADAFQLGAAFVWCKQRPARRTFVSSDLRLSEAARSAGFSVLSIP
jgi:predicted nucleic acid-binding protein